MGLIIFRGLNHPKGFPTIFPFRNQLHQHLTRGEAWGLDHYLAQLIPTVDGSEIQVSPVDMVVNPHLFTWFQKHPNGGCLGVFSINSNISRFKPALLRR